MDGLAGSNGGSRAVGYLRRSTDRQEQSIPDQQKTLIEYAAKNGIELVQFYVDNAISGTSTTQRKAFRQMIEDAQRLERTWKYILVYDVKRFGRLDNDEAGYYRHILKTKGVEILYVTENFSGDGTDDLLRPVKQWQAREESKDLSKVTIRGLLSKVKGGTWMGGVPPLGYDLQYENDRGEFLFRLRHEPDGSKRVLDQTGKVTRSLARGETLSISKRDRAKLVPGDANRVKVVQDIFRMYATEGRGYMSIADWLNRKATPAPRGPEWSRIYNGRWGDSTVREIILNPIYGGDLVWNRRTDGRFHKISNGVAVPRTAIHGQRLVPNAKSDWIVIRDTHTALVSRLLMDEVAKRRAARQVCQGTKTGPPVGGWSGSRSRFVLSGLIYCGACGNRYQGCFKVKGRPRKDGSAIRTFYYNCSGYIRSGTSVCDSRLVLQDVLERVVTKVILDHYRQFMGDDGRERLEEAVRDLSGTSDREIQSALKRASANEKAVDRKMNNLLDNLTPANRDLVDKRLTTLRTEKEDCRMRIEQLESLAASQTRVQETAYELMKFLGSLELMLSQGVPEDKRVALRRCVEKLVVAVESQRVKIQLRQLPTSTSSVIELVGNLAAF